MNKAELIEALSDQTGQTRDETAKTLDALIETIGSTLAKGEKRLRSGDYQEQMASAIFTGIKDYFAKHPPAGTQIAAVSRQHKISPGDTLSALAVQYRVSVERLRAANRLKNDRIRVGQVLTIPGDSEG